MKSTRLKSIFYSALYVGLLSLLLIPLYMYFSHDVQELIKEYPHLNKIGDSVTIEIKPEKPKKWTELGKISNYAKWAIILSEDWAFYQHEGIDVEQIKVALNEMLEEKRFRGASTITQQMVKNVYLSEERTLWRKLHEFILAQKVERVLTKNRILEIYLNVIEYGPGIYGIHEASYHYFRKHPSQLNPKESAFLAMLLPSPKRYYISYKQKQLTPFARQRINAILSKMKTGKVISPEVYEEQKLTQLSWEQN